ncbi:MAG: class I SAM-dependent methyltransferase [Acidimicrobiia bacterium]|nr:class I SAM-dependent methyltransferase [Acidimicrobiia bacterium]
MGVYEDRILPRLIDVVLGTKGYGKLRRRAAAGLEGDIIEVGFGSGLNVPHYPPEVTTVAAVDPAASARRLAAPRIAESPVEVTYVGLDGQDLPLPDASVDHALSTWTLCTIPDAPRALTEIRRVLRPGGSLHFLEHGRSDDERVARWQDRLTPIQRKVAGGCHLNRSIDQLVADAGFELTHLARFEVAGPSVLTSMYQGVATPLPE